MCGNFMFHNDFPMVKYCHNSLNSCCFSSLESAYAITKQIKSTNSISLRIEESLKSKMGNHIDFLNDILKNEKIIKGEPKVYYSLRKYKKKVSYDILTYISKNVTLIRLMNSLGNVNHAISVVGYWIFDSKYEKALILNKELLDFMSVSEE